VCASANAQRGKGRGSEGRGDPRHTLWVQAHGEGGERSAPVTGQTGVVGGGRVVVEGVGDKGGMEREESAKLACNTKGECLVKSRNYAYIYT
jgi:hypothetical protein